MPGQVLQVLNKILFDNEGSFKDSVLSDLQRKRFASAKRFASWLRLVPNNKLSGGRIISSKTPKGKNAIALALRQAANSIGNQKEHPLTPFFKRIAYRKGRNAAITATARKLAVIIWNMVTKTQPYRQPNFELLLEKRKYAQVKNIKSRLFRLNLTDDEMTLLFQKTSFPSVNSNSTLLDELILFRNTVRRISNTPASNIGYIAVDKIPITITTVLHRTINSYILG